MLYPVENEVRQVKVLNGIWKFKKEETEEQGFREKWYEAPLKNTIEMPVPASYNDITTDRALRDHVGWVWYERIFAVPRAWMDQRLVLRFGSVTHHAVVYINGTKVTEHKGGFLPFEAEISAYVNAGENRVCVAVSNLLDWTCLPCGEYRKRTDEIYPDGKLEQEYYFDFFNYAGIHRPVKLYTTPVSYIKDVYVNTRLLGEDGEIEYKITADGQEDAVEVTLLDEDGREAAKGCGAGGSLHISKVHRWHPGNAYLYEMHIRMGEDHYTLPVGVRSIEVTDRQFLVNGEAVYFKGFGKHEDSDIRGKGIDEVLNVRDFELMKWIGANSFRTSHYPYSEEIMQMADRQGFLVIDEVPAVGMNFFSNEPVFLEERVNDKTLEYHKETLKELYERDKNHPCVVMWSVANEARTDEEQSYTYFREVTDYMRALDPERPLTATMNVEVEDEKTSQLYDVVCINRYYSWYSETGRLETIYPNMKADLEKWHQKFHKPVMITEYGADTIAGLHKLPEVIFSEEYQTRYLEENNRAIDSCDFVIGEHIWAFADFMTSFGLRRIDGNKKGIFTRERQPKAAAFAVRRRWTEA